MDAELLKVLIRITAAAAGAQLEAMRLAQHGALTNKSTAFILEEYGLIPSQVEKAIIEAEDVFEKSKHG